MNLKEKEKEYKNLTHPSDCTRKENTFKLYVSSSRNKVIICLLNSGMGLKKEITGVKKNIAQIPYKRENLTKHVRKTKMN